MNNKLLENKELIKMIKDEITLIKQTYALPVYSSKFITNSEDEHLELLIPDSLFLDTLLCQVRGIIIGFSKKLANNTRIQEKKLKKDIEVLEEIIDMSSADSIKQREDLEKNRSRRNKRSENARLSDKITGRIY